MPELPEIEAYLAGMERIIVGEPLTRVRLRSPSLLRTWDPPLSAAEARAFGSRASDGWASESSGAWRKTSTWYSIS